MIWVTYPNLVLIISRGPRCLPCNLYGHKSFECRRANLNNTSTPPSGVNAVHGLPSPVNMFKDATIFWLKTCRVSRHRQQFNTPCSSPYASQVVVVKKKDRKKSRVCIDYSRLNRKLIKDNYPLPLIDDILDCLQNAKKVESRRAHFCRQILSDKGYHMVTLPFHP
ncbi:uncharacterized protein K02A2.6-like [Trichonephila clavipes]|nr:uncharacterized protein K02A2.6-like [Trichonephila clavipes]